MSKIKLFKDLLDEGKTLEEAIKESGVAKATAKIQFNKWKKTKEDIS